MTQPKILFKFYIFHAPSHTYTAIGAENIFHACNKATKLWKDKWSGVARICPTNPYWKFRSIKNFGALILVDAHVCN